MTTQRKSPRKKTFLVADSNLWVERLLDLFFDVDAAVKAGENVPPTILASYKRAEEARLQL